MKLGVPWTAKGKSPARSAAADEADAASVHERLDDLTRQLERLSRITAGKVRPPSASAATARRPAPDEDADPPVHMDQREEEPAAEDLTPSPDIARFAGRRKLNRAPLQTVYAGEDLDDTLAEIAARQRVLDSTARGPEPRHTEAPRRMTPPSQNLSGLEDQLRAITTQIESLRRPSAAEDAVPALRQELSEISRSLAEAMPRRAIETIEAEVRGLAERLDQSRQSGVDTGALANLERGLAEVRDALQSLKPAESLVSFQAAIQGLARKIDGIAAHQQDPAVLQQLESAITGLRGVVTHVASDDTLARLTEEVRGIGARLERTNGAAKSDAIAKLERQLGQIAEAIEQNSTHGRTMPAQVETMVRGLADRIEKLQPSRGDTIAFGQLEDRIARLVEKLDASGARLGQLEAIERGLTDVLVHLEEQRSRSGSQRPTESDPAVASLKRDLDAVNGTLNRLVDRLATIETGLRGAATRPAAVPAAATPVAPAPAAAKAAAPAPVAAAVVAAAPSPPPKPVPVPAASPPGKLPEAQRIPPKAPILPAAVAAGPAASAQPPAAPSERLVAAANAQRPAAPRERPPIDPNLPPDHPLEPGAAHGRSAPSPADRIAASEAALGPAKPAEAGDTGAKTNFVAAARRAAQAALRLPAAPDDKTAASAAPEVESPVKPSLRQRIAGRVRSLLVGASVVILTLGAVHVTMSLLDGPDDAPPAKQAAPVAKAPPKSTARLQPNATIAGSSAGDAAPQPSAAPRPTEGATNADTAAASPSDITGSIPQTTPSAQPAAVPLPPNRPGADNTDNSRLAAAASAGDAAAAYELAVRYIEGRGVPQSYADAAQWLARASKQGMAAAQFRLGSLNEKGLGVKKDLNEARRLYTAAAGKGNAKAMHNLAVLHAEGIDGKPDYTVAIRWFRKAADHGIADSQYNLGVLYARGVGVEHNMAESYKWFALAAQQGDQEAAKKRDEVAARLDAESLMAARLATKTWTALPQPDEMAVAKGATDVAHPSAPAPAGKRRPRTGAPMKLGPG